MHEKVFADSQQTHAEVVYVTDIDTVIVSADVGFQEVPGHFLNGRGPTARVVGSA